MKKTMPRRMIILAVPTGEPAVTPVVVQWWQMQFPEYEFECVSVDTNTDIGDRIRSAELVILSRAVSHTTTERLTRQGVQVVSGGQKARALDRVRRLVDRRGGSGRS